MNTNQKTVYDALLDIQGNLIFGNDPCFWQEAKIKYIIKLKLDLFAYSVNCFMFNLNEMGRTEPDAWSDLLDELFARISPEGNLMQDCDQLEAFLRKEG